MTDYRFAGWGKPQDGFCEMPRKMVNVSTGEWYWGRCGSARPSRCGPCAEIKRGDIAAVGRSGWADRPSQAAYWVTLTAPGVDVLPWDTSRCTHSPGVRCSGDIGCVSDPIALARWHSDVGQRWSWFMTDLRRELGSVEFFKTWELQARGALHLHSMMRAERVSQRRFVEVVKRCALRWGFGEQVKVDVIDLGDAESGARKAGYCAKYATKSADDLRSVRRIDSDGVISVGGYRSWSASRHWGDTMRMIKLRRCQWAAGVVAATGATESDLVGDGAAGALDLNQEIYAQDLQRLPAIASAALL